MLNNILILVAIITQTTASAGETELIKKLLDPKSYNKDVIPQFHGNLSGIELKFGLGLVQINELNVMGGYLVSTMWIRMVWQDDRLKYNGTKTPGEPIEVLRIPSSRVWTPSMQLANTYRKGPDATVSGLDNVLVYPSGEVLWVPHANIKSSCIIDPTYFPFDQQTCLYKFYDPFHSAAEMKLSLYNNKNFIDMSDYWKSPDWTFVEAPAYINAHNPPGESKTEDVTYYITLKRRGGHYSLTLIIPAILISFITVLTFGLPADSAEKLMTSFVGIVSLILMLIHIGNVVPPTFTTIPIITKYVLFVVFLNILSLFGSVLILSLASKESEMPEWIREIVLVKLKKIVRVNTGNDKEVPLENEKGVKEGIENHAQEPMEDGDNRIYDAENTILTTLSKKKMEKQKNEAWQSVAVTLDRTCLLIFLILTVIGAAVYLASSNIGKFLDEDAAISLYHA